MNAPKAHALDCSGWAAEENLLSSYEGIRGFGKPGLPRRDSARYQWVIIFR